MLYISYIFQINGWFSIVMLLFQCVSSQVFTSLFFPTIGGGSSHVIPSSGCAKHGAGASVSWWNGDPEDSYEKESAKKNIFPFFPNFFQAKDCKLVIFGRQKIVCFYPEVGFTHKKVNLSFNCLAKQKPSKSKSHSWHCSTHIFWWLQVCCFWILLEEGVPNWTIALQITSKK